LCFARGAGASLSGQQKQVAQRAAKSKGESVQYKCLVELFDSKGKGSRYIVVVGRYNLLFARAASSGDSAKAYHLFDIRSLGVVSPTQLDVSFRSSSSVIKVSCAQIAELLWAVRSAYQAIAVGFPADSLCIEASADVLLELPPVDVGVAGGFIATYRAWCNFYRCAAPSDAVEQFVVDLVERGVDTLDFAECPGAEGQATSNAASDVRPLLAALNHNRFFRSVSLDECPTAAAATALAAALKTNRWLTRLALTRCSARAGADAAVEALGDALAFNASHNALQAIDLSGTPVGARAFSHLCLGLRGLAHGLRSLLLADCSLGYPLVCELFETALGANLPMSIGVEELDLSGNQLGEVGSKAVATWLAKLGGEAALRRLSLANCALDITHLCRPLHTLERLERLDLSRNPIDFNSAQLLFSLAELAPRSLRRFALAGCALGTPYAEQLLVALLNNESLAAIELAVGDNRLVEPNFGRAFAALVPTLPRLSALAVLDFAGSSFKASALVPLLTSLAAGGGADQLHTLVLDRALSSKVSRQEAGAVGNALAQLVAELPALRALSLAGSFPGEALLPFASSLLSNHSLDELDVRHNRCGDALAVALGHMLRFNVSLRSLRLDGNRCSLTGWSVLLLNLGYNVALHYIDFPWLDHARAAASLSTRRAARLRDVVLQVHATVASHRPADAPLSCIDSRLDAYLEPKSLFEATTIDDIAPLGHVPEQLLQHDEAIGQQEMAIQGTSNNVASSSSSSSSSSSVASANAGGVAASSSTTKTANVQQRQQRKQQQQQQQRHQQQKSPPPPPSAPPPAALPKSSGSRKQMLAGIEKFNKRNLSKAEVVDKSAPVIQSRQTADTMEDMVNSGDELQSSLAGALMARRRRIK
jgi:hypothetical protein